MRRILLLFLISLPALYVLGCKKANVNPPQGVDSVIVDSALYYHTEIMKREFTIAQLKGQIHKDSIIVKKLNDSLNMVGKQNLKLQEDMDSINRQLTEQIALQEHLGKAFESETFYTLLLYLPITARYDSVDIASKKDFVETLHLKELHPVTTEIYYDMMVNYQTYLNEVIECVSLVLDEFRISGKVKPDIDFVKKSYTTKLERTQYWGKRHVAHRRSEIPFIEKRLTQIEDLFSEDAKYTQEAFQSVYNDLIRR